MSTSLRERLLVLHRDADFCHPETRTGEIWVTNVPFLQFDALVFKTKRKGVHAYDIRSMEIAHHVPVFISLDEFYSIDWDNMKWFK